MERYVLEADGTRTASSACACLHQPEDAARPAEPSSGSALRCAASATSTGTCTCTSTGRALPQVLPALIEAAGVKLVARPLTAGPTPSSASTCAGFQMLLRLMQNGRTWVKVSGVYRLGKEAAATLRPRAAARRGRRAAALGERLPVRRQESRSTETIDAADGPGARMRLAFCAFRSRAFRAISTKPPRSSWLRSRRRRRPNGAHHGRRPHAHLEPARSWSRQSKTGAGGTIAAR